MIRKVYEVDPMVCPQCGGQMRIIAFLTDSAVVDRIIEHLKLTFSSRQTSSASDRSLRAFDGCRWFGRIFFLIFTSPEG